MKAGRHWHHHEVAEPASLQASAIIFLTNLRFSMTLQLTGTDSRGSMCQVLSNGVLQPFSYSPFGATASRTGEATASVPGFNGERADPLTGVTHLGNGYRAYSPTLQRFTCPDSESPFGIGGINPYAYCSNDPINQSDPSGHGPLMWLIEGVIWGAAKLGKQLALSEAAAAAVSTTETVIWGVSATASLATGIASKETSSSNPEVSAKLGWASLGLGIAAATFGIPKIVGRIKKMQKPKLNLAKNLHIKSLDKDAIQVQRLKTQTMGGDIKMLYSEDNISLNNPYHIFMDTYKNNPRVNVVGHGATGVIDESFSAISMGAGKYLSPSDVALSIIQHTFGDCNFKNIRLISCYSAEGCHHSFAQKLANLTGVPVKGYHGTVTLTGHFDSSLAVIIKDEIDSLIYLGSGEAKNFMPEIFNPLM
ncbi:RHS repeat-associated core domain-containing protein [Rahnella contaminans]|uniref:RHS repeat-associated core domain-containing protein n=1 Tax=Rahnella contaminans TaxID=2703882 RepID=UPI003C2AF4C8